MFSIDVKFRIAGREVSFDKFSEALIAQILDTIRDQAQKNLPQRRPPEPATFRSPEPSRPGVKPRVVSIPEAARLLGLSQATIRAWVYRRRLHHVRLGRRVMIPIETVDKILSEGLE
jgi:excisionase family DNA binding protein